MDIRTHIRIWVGLFAICLFVSPLLRKGESMHQFVEVEIKATQETFGPTFSGWILDSVDALFANSPAAAVVAVARYGTTGKDREERIARNLGKGAHWMVKTANSYFTGITLAAYVACMRLLINVVWFGMLAPVLIAAVIDGFAQRAIKQYVFGTIRPAAFSLMAMIIVPFVFAPLLYLTIPVSVSPTIIPIWVFLGCMPLALLIANTQPVFGQH